MTARATVVALKHRHSTTRTDGETRQHAWVQPEVTFTNASGAQRTEELTVVARRYGLTVGSTVDVVYDPADPSDVVLKIRAHLLGLGIGMVTVGARYLAV